MARGTARAARASARRSPAARRPAPTRRGSAGGSRRRSRRRDRRAPGCATSAAVHGPMPGIARSLAYASGSGIATISSNRAARAATARTRSARRRSSPMRVERVVGDRGERGGRGQQSQPERPGRRLAPPGDDAAVGAPRLGAGHLLLEDRRDQRLEDGPAPADPQPLVAAVEVGEQAVGRRESGPVVVDPGERRCGLQRPRRARPQASISSRSPSGGPRSWPARRGSASPGSRAAGRSASPGRRGREGAARRSGRGRADGPGSTVRRGIATSLSRRCEARAPTVIRPISRSLLWFPTTCDAYGSSRARCSSPCSPRSPSPDPSDPRAPAPKP